MAAVAAATAQARASNAVGRAGAGEADELRLAPALAGHLYVAPVRLTLGAAGLGAAALRGLDTGPALLAWASGALIFAVVIVSGGRYFRRMEKPIPAPPHRLEARRETLLAALLPSTLGVAVLVVVAVVANPTLAAFLAGILAGMGFTALVTAAQIFMLERELVGRLLVDRRGRAVYLARDAD